MKSIVLLTDTLTPYRHPFFTELAVQAKKEKIDFKLLVMQADVSYRSWKYSDFQQDYAKLLKRKVLFGKADRLYINSDLRLCLDELKPDILVLSGGYPLLPVWQALFWARHKHCKLFFWSESHLNETRDYNPFIYWIRDRVRRIFYGKFRGGGYWYPGEKAKELILKYGSPEAEYIHVPNLIDNKSFCQLQKDICLTVDEVREKYGLSKGKCLFFSAARLTHVKGLMPFMEMLKTVKGYEKIQLAVAGNGELETELREYAQKYHVDLKLLGYQDKSAIVELLYCADVFFLPSLSDPNPLSCIEALWCGKPFFVSEHVGNYPEVVEQGKNGYVFSYHNVQDFQEKITALLEADADWYKQAEACSREIAENNFEIEKNTAEIIQTMKRLF